MLLALRRILRQAVVACLLFDTEGVAERLPIRTYTTADGLPSSAVNCIVRDSRGFLWLCTRDGLLRFDGNGFVNFGVREGIPNRHVTAFLETRAGSFWIGTQNGLARFEPDRMRNGGSPFVPKAIPGPEPSRNVTVLAEGPDGTVWCGTRRGLFRIRPSGALETIDLGLPSRNLTIEAVQSIVADGDGSMWIGTGGNGLFRWNPNGVLERNGISDFTYALTMDRHGRIWAAQGNIVSVFDRPSASVRFPLWRVFGRRDGLPDGRSRALLEGEDGAMWVATENGLAVLRPQEHTFRRYDLRNGLSDVQLRALGKDPEDNVWIAAESALMRLSNAGLMTYDTADGLGGNSFVSAFEGRDGQSYFVNGIRTVLINRFDGNRFTSVRPLTLIDGKPIRYMGWGIGQTVLRDRAGDWWVPTGEGLCRYSGIRRLEELEHTPPTAVYTTRDGLPANDIFHLYEDRRGDLWIGTVDPPGLATWERKTSRIYQVGPGQGFVTPNPPAAFAEDPDGDLWVGMLWNGLARFRNGRWRMFGAAEGVPGGSLWSILADRRGRVWAASSNAGLVRIDEAASDHPRFTRYSVRQGLASDLINSIVEDRTGTLYVAGARGVDALDPETNLIRHFGAADGLAAGDIAATLCDSSGALWFGAKTGLSRLALPRARRAQPPPVYITRLRIAGVARPLSGLGDQAISELTLNPEQNHIDVDFASPAFHIGGAILYQYRLDSRAEWTEPMPARGLSLAGLGSGKYRFEVRAIRDGVPSTQPAVISFQVLPPMWRRWWSLSSAVLLAIVLFCTAHRYRVARVVEMERVRTRIAMDLHDDIGSTLSQIAILSEVARLEAGDGPATRSFARLTEISREVGSSLGDIVWAMNPERDRGADLIQRMRRFGEDLFNGDSIEFDCTAADAVLAACIPPDVRREVYLVFKESVANIARHANCRRATARLSLAAGELLLEVSDDGGGFDPEKHGNHRGNGLASMQRRARHLRGSLSVLSEPGRGTTILLKVPFRRYLFV